VSTTTKKGRSIFLSYARTDQEPAQRTADHLRKAGFQVWDPDQEILPGADWTAELKSALESAQAMLVFISPAGMESRSVSHEIEYALGAKHLSGRLIPVVVRPTKDAPWIFKLLRSVRYQGPTKTTHQIIELLSQPADVPQPKRRAG
jgi:hypothetical protein